MILTKQPQGLRQGRKAFTLIELLIVMSIIAVLVGLALPAMMRARESSNRMQCSNNLRQFGIAFTTYHQQQNYFPTAGLSDLSAPNYVGPTAGTVVGTNSTLVTGFQQEAGWPIQILPFMDAEVIATGNNSSTALVNVVSLMATPHRFYFCPSRRGMTTSTIPTTTYPTFPHQPVYPNSTSATLLLDYSTLQGKQLTVAMIDYAACNGNSTTVLNMGAVRSQSTANRVTQSMIKDGLSHTLLISEKAVNTSSNPVNTNEDDIGYFSGFSAANYNNIRFTAPTLLPLYDGQLTSVSGGAFGSAHPGSLSALMADGSVQNLSYTINSTIYSGLGTIAGREVITDQDLNFQ